jgi:tellurium resistance protein TerD
MARGSNVALTREIPGLTGVVLGVALSSAEAVLMDTLVVATLLCDGRGRVLSDEHVVFFNQLTEPSMAVTKLAEVVGRDTEQVEVDLDDVPDDVIRIVIVVYINEAFGQRRTLGQLREVTVRVLNLADDRELVRSANLAPELHGETGLVLAELYRHSGNWKFKVIGQGYANGITSIAADYGIGL